MKAKHCIAIAAVSGFLAVALGAFASHGLRAVLNERLYEVWQTAVQYQMYHALALLAVGVLMKSYPLKGIRIAAYLFISGSLVFSGSLYLLVLSGSTVFGAITPLGGCLLLAGWLVLAISMMKS